MVRLFNGVIMMIIMFVVLLIVIARVGPVQFAALTKPSSEGYIADVIALKTKAAKALASRSKIVVVSASGGMFSIACMEITTTLGGVPCVNMALPSDVGLAQVLDFGRSAATRNDVVLMTLEYQMLYLDSLSGAPVRGGENALLASLGAIDLKRLFRIDLAYVVNGVSENLLAAAGNRPYNIEKLFTELGDRKSHTTASAVQYAEKRNSDDFDSRKGVITEGAKYYVGRFLDWAKENGVPVIATLQPTYEDTPIRPDWLDSIAALYTSHGAIFVRPAGLHRYPRDSFYDGDPHLNEEMQHAHSRLVAREIAPYLPPALMAK